MEFDQLYRLCKKKTFKIALFIVVFTGISYYYNYQEIIYYRPTSIHQWRNSVSASIALNYAYEGSFFHPRTNNMQVDDYTSDITITEFPAIYYFIGMLYRIFGFHEVLYKLVNLFIGYCGLFFLFILGLRVFKNTLYALVLPVFMFTSPIYIYYINNFIPDAPSLSIVFIGLYFFYRFYEDKRNYHFALACIFLCFAGLLKTPALLLFFAIVGLFLLENILKFRFKGEGKLFDRWLLQLLGIAFVLLIIIAWYGYAKIYTDKHGGVVSLVEIRPIWRLSNTYIKEIWEAVTIRFREGLYHSPMLLIIIMILFIHNIVYWKRYNRLLSVLTVLTFTGGICFSLLFYRSMKNHDYYQMNNLIIPVLILTNFMLYMKNKRAIIYKSLISRLVLTGILLYLIIFANKILNTHYYNSWIHNYTIETVNKKFDKITPYLRSLGIDRTDKVYSTYDPSINITLYLMDQKGFTDFFRTKELFSDKVAFFKQHGCKYVIIGDSTNIDKDPSEIGLEKIGEFHGAEIYSFD